MSRPDEVAPGKIGLSNRSTPAKAWGDDHPACAVEGHDFSGGGLGKCARCSTWRDGSRTTPTPDRSEEVEATVKRWLVGWIGGEENADDRDHAYMLRQLVDLDDRLGGRAWPVVARRVRSGPA